MRPPIQPSKVSDKLSPIHIYGEHSAIPVRHNQTLYKGPARCCPCQVLRPATATPHFWEAAGHLISKIAFWPLHSASFPITVCQRLPGGAATQLAKQTISCHQNSVTFFQKWKADQFFTDQHIWFRFPQVTPAPQDCLIQLPTASLIDDPTLD